MVGFPAVNKRKLYNDIRTSLGGILSDPIPWESGLVSLIALCKEKLSYVSWIGAYRAQGDSLWIGPYQGPLACLKIPAGKGVCGESFAKRKTIVVNDVHQFPGHIVCDPKSRSEIVLPLFHRGQLDGVLDLDSHQISAFDEIDEQELGSLLEMLEDLK